jgi:hypothetical protein
MKMKDKISSVCLLRIFVLTACLLFSKPTQAQEPISNEYRLIFVPTYAISKDLFLTSYLGYVNNADNKTVSTYVGLPGLFVYKLNPNFQAQGGAFLIFNNDNSPSNKDNKELRFVIGEKINLPNSHNLRLSNWTRYELRSFNYEDNNLDKTNNRFRSRFAIEFPISKNAWQPKSWYGISDFEVFYTVEKCFFDKFRQRFGLGYIVDKQWTLNLVYHIQLDRTAKDLRPTWTTNIFRLDVRWTIPHRKHTPLTDAPDAD